ncbi:MAG: translocation protein TolB, partial [Bacteroidota bacterium]
MRLSLIWTLFCSLFLTFFSTHAQLPVNSDEFGKNRVQYRSFTWQYLSTPNFEIHFYGDGETIARQTATIAEQEYERITRTIGFAPYNKVKVFVYHSVADLQQSNVGVSEQDFSLGGQTNFNKSIVELAYTGSRSSYRDELIREISDALLFEMMYGGNLKEILQSSYLLSLPDWFISGASSYVTESWSLEMDDFVRAQVADRKFDKPDLFTGEEARYIGHSIWNFIAIKYGQNALANILNLTRIVRNERGAIQSSIGLPYSD